MTLFIFLHWRTDCKNDDNGRDTHPGKDLLIFLPGAWIPCCFHLASSQMGWKWIGVAQQLNQKALHMQDLWNAHEFSRSVNVPWSVCRKWNYLMRHFALSDMVKHLWGLSEAAGLRRKTTQLPCHLLPVFSQPKSCKLSFSVSQGSKNTAVPFQYFPDAFSNYNSLRDQI